MTGVETKTHYVSHVAPALIQHPELSIGAKATAVALLMHNNRTKTLCYPTEEALAAELDVKDRTIRRYLVELRECGLIDWKKRKAPRGRAEGRGNLYDLSGLHDLCARPIATVEEVMRTKTAAGNRTKTTSRDRTKTTRHASENRAIEQNRHILDSKSLSNAVEEESNSESCRCYGAAEKRYETRDRTKTTPHVARNVQGSGPDVQCVAPDGTVFENEVFQNPFDAALEAMYQVGGGEFNRESLSALIDDYGDEAVWYQARWFPRRMADRETPPRNMVAYFISCVRNGYAVNPKWPEPKLKLRRVNEQDELDALVNSIIPF